MARARDPNRDKAFDIYKEHEGNITNRAIAEMLGVPEKTIGSWKSKSKDNWDAKLNGVLQSDERSTPNKKDKQTQKGERKRSGNPNPPNQFTKRNRAAMIHGLRSKFLFPEQIEIMEALQEFDVVDQLWLQIELSFSAIIRAQKIMWVEDPFDHLREISGEMNGDSIDYKVVYAHERFESYIKAQTRAFAEHRSLVKQFLDMTTEDDERRLKLEQMQLNIEKTNKEIELRSIAIRKENGDSEEEYEDDGFMDALMGTEVNWDE